MYKTCLILTLLSVSFSTLSCVSEFTERDPKLLILVRSDQIEAIKQNLEDYDTNGFQKEIVVLTSVDPWYVRDIIASHESDGVMLIGTIPSIDFERNNGPPFQMDWFYSSPSTVYYDTDNDGIFDLHSPWRLDRFIARIPGTVDQIKFYFDKLARYKASNRHVTKASVYADDPYAYIAKPYAIDKISDDLSIVMDTDESTTTEYKNTIDTSDLVYQLIHAGKDHFTIYENEDKNEIKIKEIMQSRVSFYLYFSCGVGAYIAPKLIAENDSAITIVASTESGGILYPTRFFEHASDGFSFGESFIYWAQKWISKERYSLGLTIFGDPTIYF